MHERKKKQITLLECDICDHSILALKGIPSHLYVNSTEGVDIGEVCPIMFMVVHLFQVKIGEIANVIIFRRAMAAALRVNP